VPLINLLKVVFYLEFLFVVPYYAFFSATGANVCANFYA